MFTKEEKDILKELVVLEIEQVKELISNADKSDKTDLNNHLELLNQISNKLN